MAVAERVAQDSDSTLLRESLIRDALNHQDVRLSNGQTSSYYIDAKAALLQGPICAAVGRLIAERASELGAVAVGGLTMGADPLATAAIFADQRLYGFFVRKDRKEHGLQKWIEGPQLANGTRCLVVDDVVTTGGSTVQAIERCLDAGLQVVGTVCVLDRMAGGAAKIEAAGGAPFTALATIDEVHPDRDDR